MTRFLIIWTCLLCLLSVAGPGSAADKIPEAGLQAEMAGNWDEAARIYRQELEDDPDRVELWSRLADIQIRLGRNQAAALSLLKAIDLRPEDAGFYFRLSQVHAVNGQAQAALAAVSRAADLEPGNLEYLRAKARLANWSGQTETALQTYREILQRVPDDAGARLGMARAQSWSGRLDRAARDYRLYLGQNPGDRQAWLEAVRVESWRGAYARALRLLERYRDRFGSDPDYLGEKARILAWAGRPEQALRIVRPLLAESPEDYQLLYTQTVAFHQAHRPEAALAGLATLERLQPSAQEVADLGLVIRTPLRSRLTVGGFYYRDSDDIRILRGDLELNLALDERTRLMAGALTESLRAESGTGLEAADGSESVSDQRGWLGGSHRFSSRFAMDGRIGGARVENDRQSWTGRLGLDWQPADSLGIRLQADRDLYGVSPRSVSLAIKRNAGSLHLTWQPDLLWTIEARAGYSLFSDENRRWETILAPRRSVLRTGAFNLDLGVSTWWFGFSDDLDHGYYDPATYRRHAVNLFGYWKLSPNDGISLHLAPGIQKDESMDHYRFGTDVAVEGVFGIYRDWQLRMSLGRTDRDQSGGSFDGTSARLELTRRF